MYKFGLGLFVGISLLAITNVNAQNYTYSRGQEVVKESVNMMELSNYEKTHPPVFARKDVMQENDDAMETHWVKPATDPALDGFINCDIMRLNSNGATERTYSSYMPASSGPTDTFQAKLTDGTSIPPDTHGGVDATYAVCAINSSVSIKLRSTHASVSTVSLATFWGSTLLGSGGSPFDPRVHYDPYTDRWIMVAVSVTSGASSYSNSRILIAISATGNPTGTWYKYSVLTDASNLTWLDFPNVGFNNKWVTVAGNYFGSSMSSGSFTNAAIFVFNKATMMAGTGAPFVKITDGGSGGGFSDCPAVTYSATEPSMFVMDVYNPGAGRLRLRKITGPVGSPVLSGTIFTPTSSQHWQFGAPTVSGTDDFGPQVGTTRKLQTNDDRLNNLTFRNGKLWCAHNVFLPATGTVNRASIMWWQTDTISATNQNGLIDGAAGTLMFGFPSISVNANNDALMGFAYMSSGLHPSAAYVYRTSSDTISKMRTPYVYRHGQATYYVTFGGSKNRWGDYSATCVDPINNLDFWTLQESVASTNNWDTWWAYIRMCSYLAAPAGGTGPTTACQGTVQTFSVAPVAGATSYGWTITGGSGWSGTSTTNSANITVGTGTAVISVSGVDTCGPGTAYTFTVVATPLPTVSIAAVGTICISSPSATFTTTATGSPTSYNWTVTGSGWTGSSSTSTLTTTVGTGTGTIVVSGTNACGTGPAVTLNVTPGNPPAAATTITMPSPLCAGGTAVFTTPAVSGATSYTWTVSGIGWSGTSTTTSVNVTVGSGTGTITVTPVNSCGNGTSFSLNSLFPTAAPTATFSESTHITTVGTDITCTYTGAAPGGTTYAWTFPGGTPPSSTSPGPVNVQWAAPGTYTVSLTVNNGGCTATSTDTVRVNSTTDMKELRAGALSANLVPNPNDGTFDIAFDKIVSTDVIVKLYDMAGHIVYTKEFNAANNNKVSVTTTGLPNGVYSAAISVNGKTLTRKFTITR